MAPIRSTFNSGDEQARRTAKAQAALVAGEFSINALSETEWQVRSASGRRYRVSAALPCATTLATCAVTGKTAATTLRWVSAIG